MSASVRPEGSADPAGGRLGSGPREAAADEEEAAAGSGGAAVPI